MSRKKNASNKIVDSNVKQENIVENSTEVKDLPPQPSFPKEENKEEIIDPVPTFPPENTEPIIENTTIETPVIKKDEDIVSTLPVIEKIENKEENKNITQKSIEKVEKSNKNDNILININIIRNGSLSFKGHMKISDIILKINKFEDISVQVTSTAIADILKNQLSEKDAGRIIVKKK